ncbi:hypothetical protein I7I48_11600 [Histoplasma ohiense]|nr:hypothetical protein I7I48_11600 [Histoplasma ohiense (nom. inval.)]
MEAPISVNRWPGTTEIANKVPTKLWYRAGCRKPISWGFDEPDELHPGMDVVDCFKLYLDPDFGFANSAEMFWTHEDVQAWFIDFFTALRLHIIQYIRNSEYLPYPVVSDWRLHPVEYVFSFPTTWQNPKVVDAFCGIVRSSGFGDCEAHSVEIKLNEAAAAAAYSAKTFRHQWAVQNPEGSRKFPPRKEKPLENGSVILICDAGGGTTDVAVLKVSSIEKYTIRGQREDVLQLEQLDYVSGKPFGSVQIDQAFQREVESRLEKIDYKSDDRRWSPKSAARKLTKGDFQALKLNYGCSVMTTLRKRAIRIPGLPAAYNSQEAGIEGGRIVLEENDLRRLFEEQIRHIFGLIDEQLLRIGDITPPIEVTHMILSGGLGASRYVQDWFITKYGYGREAKGILISKEPQLAVSRGLVIDRVHRLRHGHSVLSTRCSSSSYGIVVNNRVRTGKTPPSYNSHVKISPYDGRRYIVNQVQWLLERGQIIQHRYICQKLDRVFEATSSEIDWKILIAMSRSPAARLPRTIDEGDACVICEIESRVGGELLRQHARPAKQKRWSSIRKAELQKIQYEVRLYIESSCLTFEVWLGDQVIGNSDEIPVAWQYTSIDEADNEETQTECPVDWSNCGLAKGVKDDTWPTFLR